MPPPPHTTRTAAGEAARSAANEPDPANKCQATGARTLPSSESTRMAGPCCGCGCGELAGDSEAEGSESAPTTRTASTPLAGGRESGPGRDGQLDGARWRRPEDSDERVAGQPHLECRRPGPGFYPRGRLRERPGRGAPGVTAAAAAAGPGRWADSEASRRPGRATLRPRLGADSDGLHAAQLARRWRGAGVALAWRWRGAGVALARRWRGADEALARRWRGAGEALARR
jgi:hypothetical protein